MFNLNKARSGLKNYYTILIEIGVIAALSITLLMFNIPIGNGGEKKLPSIEEQEIVTVEKTIQTKQPDIPPPPPPPQVPVEVPNDVVIEEPVINIDAELTFNEPLDVPPPPKKIEVKNKGEQEEDFFVAVEQMPELKGGLASLQKDIEYPKRARIAGIEGRVIVQFIVNEEGNVEDPHVIRGIGGGCDEEALRVIKSAKFIPGRQRGVPVRVRFSLPIYFILKE